MLTSLAVALLSVALPNYSIVLPLSASGAEGIRSDRLAIYNVRSGGWSLAKLSRPVNDHYTSLDEGWRALPDGRMLVESYLESAVLVVDRKGTVRPYTSSFANGFDVREFGKVFIRDHEVCVQMNGKPTRVVASGPNNIRPQDPDGWYACSFESASSVLAAYQPCDVHGVEGVPGLYRIDVLGGRATLVRKGWYVAGFGPGGLLLWTNDRDKFTYGKPTLELGRITGSRYDKLVNARSSGVIDPSGKWIARLAGGYLEIHQIKPYRLSSRVRAKTSATDLVWSKN